MTCLLSGRARLKFEYVKPLAQALDLDEDQLFWTALEGVFQTQDVGYVREFLLRLSAGGKNKKKKRKKKQR
jgi:hypothetical protein